MTTLGLLSVYCGVVVLASLFGGWLPSLIRLTHRRMQVAISGVAGLMLGVALYHLLPHAAEHLQNLDLTVGWMMAGLLAMFFLIRGFHSHSHGIDESSPMSTDAPSAKEADDHAHCSGGSKHQLGSPTSWIGVAIGLSVHTLIDGAALAAAVADEEPTGRFALAGLGTFLAVALHKPLDSLSITTLMLSQGWSSNTRQAVNLVYSLACPIGAILFTFGVDQLSGESSQVIGAALAVAAGVFLCISLGDLLPEIEYHSHDRLMLSAALITGVAIAYAIGFVEPAHLHDGHQHESAEHNYHAHPHLPLPRSND